MSSNVELVNAARSGDLKKVDELLLAGADVDGFDDLGRTALIRAVMGGHREVGTLIY